jgi:methylase of polypeptide subunit release factors
LLCNLPYVPDNFAVNLAAGHEPKIALYGGPDGLEWYPELFAQIDNVSFKPALILTESLPPQHNKLAQLAKTHGRKLITSEDFIQVFGF